MVDHGPQSDPASSWVGDGLVSMDPQLLAGRHLLDRRGFLSHMASGVGGIALAALMAQEGLLAAGPDGYESHPLAPGRPTFRPGPNRSCISSAPAP